MSRIKGKNTKPEIVVRKSLWNDGYRYRIHSDEIPGKPDIAFLKKKKAIFINGCFWHRHACDSFQWPKTNAEFWQEKLSATVSRDKMNYSALKKMGWDYLIAFPPARFQD
jgi:DNA mismatch endonuclease (patch repair protein)